MQVLESASIFRVSDTAQSLRFYEDTLGFRKEFDFQGIYAGVSLGSARIHLNAIPAVQIQSPGGIYITCDEVDAYAADIKNKGGELSYEPTDQPYRMRDFEVKDPDGNFVIFGKQLS